MNRKKHEPRPIVWSWPIIRLLPNGQKYLKYIGGTSSTYCCVTLPKKFSLKTRTDFSLGIFYNKPENMSPVRKWVMTKYRIGNSWLLMLRSKLLHVAPRVIRTLGPTLHTEVNANTTAIQKLF